MAGAFTNQPRTTPIYDPRQAAQLGNGDFSSLGGAGGGASGGAGANGTSGSTHLLGGGMGHTTIYAVAQSGQPKIMNPKTGEFYPAGYIPEIQDPNTHEEWRPGQDLAQVRKLTDAEFAEAGWKAIETVVRPAEQSLANLYDKGMKGLSGARQRAADGVAGSLYGKDNSKLKAGEQQVLDQGKKILGQAPQAVQGALSSGREWAGQGIGTLQGIPPSTAPQLPRMGGMTSALTSKSPERPAVRLPSAGIPQQSAPMTGGSAPRMTQRLN